ncbi:MAG: hypothetical protein ABI267_06385 [Ginsengibacter sp.]
MKFFTFLFIVFSFSINDSFAQSPTAKTTVDKTDILIGQQIHLRVETSMPDNTYRLGWFSVPDSFGNFVPIIRDKIDSTYSNGNLNFSQQIIITSFDSGRQVIPPLPLSVSTLDGDSSFTIFTDSIPINVTYSPADSTLPFHDIKNIIEVKKVFQWWIWVLIGAGAILLIVLIVYFIKKSKKKKSAEIFESKVSPYEEAMQSLDELQKENLIEKNEIKEFHTRLSEIFKRFLSRKTNTYQMHLTTDELLVELNEMNLSREQISDFANCLKMGNAVKFAKYLPPVFENEKSFSVVKEMIKAIHHIVPKTQEDGI